MQSNHESFEANTIWTINRELKTKGQINDHERNLICFRNLK